MTEQLTLELYPEVIELFADRLDSHRTPDGASRLLVALVRRGLDENALMPAAKLVLALDDRSKATP